MIVQSKYESTISTLNEMCVHAHSIYNNDSTIKVWKYNIKINPVKLHNIFNINTRVQTIEYRNEKDNIQILVFPCKIYFSHEPVTRITDTKLYNLIRRKNFL